MGDYDLQRLGGTGFQDVVSALAIKVLGAHIRPMGPGRDGGRDMLVTESVIHWAPSARYADPETWSGTTVFQAKHKSTLEGTSKDPQTFWYAIKDELDRWAKPDSSRGPVPHYFVFATNIPLTAVPGSGGFDFINAKIQGYLDDLEDESAEEHLEGRSRSAARQYRHASRDRMRQLRKWRFWDGIQVTGLLDAHEGVRRAFNGFLTAGDVLSDLSAITTTLNQEEMRTALKEHARWALLADRGVYFDEAGSESKGVPVDQVAVDLPVWVDEPRRQERVVRYIIDRAERILKPSMTTVERPRHLVVTGAPGNGKSTIAKFLTHAFRAGFLGEDVALGESHQAAVQDTNAALEVMDCADMKHRRWSFNIDLAQFAAHQATDGEYSLLHWMSAALTRQSASKDVPRWELWRWLQTWPSFIVLDGLDEVTEPSVRQNLISNIEALVGEAESRDCDLMVVVTTRPTGYQDEMRQDLFERIDLADLSVEDALHYGEVVTKVRVPDDEHRRDSIMELLRDAAHDDGLRHLLRTPLQTLIMSIIAESSRKFSPSRFELFWGYYKTIEQREQNKNLIGYGALLRDNAPQILEVHLRVGLLLQKQAETSTGFESVLPHGLLRTVVSQVLADDGFEPANRDKPLLEQILNAATHRLVLLTLQPHGGYGFDVRSLQELMAARAMTTGTIEQTVSRLSKIAASPHWRNTFLFAAGRLFFEHQPYQKVAITSLVLDLDQAAPERLGTVFPVGPGVAAEIVDDGMVAEPKYLRQLLAHALSALDEPGGFEVTAYAGMLVSVSVSSDAARDIVATGIRDALSGPRVTRGNAEEVQRAVADIGTELGVKTEVLSLASVKRDPAVTLAVEAEADWSGFWKTVQEYSEPSTEDALQAVGEALHSWTTKGRTTAGSDRMAKNLLDSETAFVMEQALGHVAAACPDLIASLRLDVLPHLWRQPVPLDDDFDWLDALEAWFDGTMPPRGP